MSKSITIGDRQYALNSPALSVGRQFRKRVSEIAEPVLPEISLLVAGLADLTDVDLNDKSTISTLGFKLAPLLLNGPDVVIDLALDYWPSIVADRQYVFEHATNADAMNLFVEAIKDAYPFGFLLSSLSISKTGGRAIVGVGT